MKFCGSADGRVLVITINRPESRNAVNLAVSQGLADAVDELDEQPGPVGRRSSPERVATSVPGMDLKAFAAGEIVADSGSRHRLHRAAAEEIRSSRPSRAMHLAGRHRSRAGDRPGGGVAHSEVRHPEVKRGLVAAGGGLLRLPRQIPVSEGARIGAHRRQFHRTSRVQRWAAAPNLVPVTLELGGKNPVVVAPGADIARSATRIARAV